MGATHYLWSPLSPELVERGLDEASQLTGVVGEEGQFKLKYSPSSRNSWSPRVVGRLYAAAGGTLIEATYPLHPVIVIFSFVHGMMLFGLSWMIAYFAYRSALNAAREEVELATGATLFDLQARQRASEHPVSDPTTPGAATGAPLSFHVATSMDAARFTLEAASGKRSRLAVQSAGVEVGGTERGLVDWNDLLEVELVEEPPENHILLRTRDQPLRIAVGGHPEADQLWLVCYLSARNARWSEAEADRERSEAERAQLSAMRSRNE